MRVYISCDIEGVTGIVSFSQCEGPSSAHFDFPFARRMLTHDVNAAIRGARSAGATEILVKDSHSTGKNLLIDELEPDVELISGYGSGLGAMMEGVDSTFDAAFLIGYHAMAGATLGVMNHALAGGLHRFRVNGVEWGEIAFNSAYAGAFGVPVVLVTTDEAGALETSAVLPATKTYATKSGYGSFLAKLKHPSVTGPGIEQAAADAVRAALQIPPLVVNGPVRCEVEFHGAEMADLAQTLAGASRLDGYTVAIETPNFLDAYRACYGLFHLGSQARHSMS